MIKQKYILTILIGMAVVFLNQKPLMAAPTGDCPINTSLDDNETVEGGKIPWRYAVELSDIHTASVDQRCKSKHLFQVPIVNMRGAIRLEMPAGSNLVIEGGLEEPTTLDFSQVNPDDPENKCVITLKSPSTNITFRNIKIAGAVASAICLGSLTDNKAVGSITFDNVDILDSAGYGIIFRTGSITNTIFSNSSIERAALGAIKIIGATGARTFKTFEAINILDEGIDSTTGLAKFSEEAYEGAQKFTMLIQSGKAHVVSESSNPIQELSVKRQGLGKIYEVRGKIVGSEAVARIQIYSVQTGLFLTYVLPTTGSYGINKDGDGFKFRISTDLAGTQVVLVPELASGSLGTSSAIIQLVGNGSIGPTPGAEAGEEGTTPPVSGEIDVTGEGEKAFSIVHCGELRGTGEAGQLVNPLGLNQEVDSDGDGLPDVYEDTNGDCIPQRTDFSDWTDPDTDDDGIPDGKETPRGQVPFSVYRDFLFAETESAEDREDREDGEDRDPHQFCDLVGGKDPCNIDMAIEKEIESEPKSNARDDDSDEDGVKDFQEDRQLTLNPWKSAVLKDPEGNSRPCSLGQYSIIGVHWDVYRWTPGGGVPQESDKHDFTAPIKALRDGAVLIPLACRNKAVSDNAFKGIGIVSDPYNADSEGDGWCDGAGAGCPNPQKKNDGCPLTTNDLNECSFECNSKEDLYRIRATDLGKGVLEFDTNDSEEPIALKMGDNNIPVLFEKSCEEGPGYCDDLDGDNIPDCFERMNVDCNPLVQSQLALNPHSADTDGDGFNDDIDINPFQKNESNEITEANRGQLRTVFTTSQVKAVTCYIDRDGDGLKDRQEDIDNDFRVPQLTLTWQEFVERRDNADKTDDVESDPLNPDSDSDGLKDDLEFKIGIGTNPLDFDTDDDGLHDRTELIADAPGSYDNAGPKGCFIKVDDLASLNRRALTEPELRTGTDPVDPDMDQDTIRDGDEVTGQYTTTMLEGGATLLDAGFTEDIDMVSNPFHADSDGDGKTDAQEYAKLDFQDIVGLAPDGKMQYFESSPCDTDTDGDGIKDNMDPCPTSGDAQCRTMTVGGPDADGDGLPDAFEEKEVDTDGDGQMNANDPDSDNDGLLDGDEDDNRNDVVDSTDHNGQRDAGETDRLDPDSDKDGLKDGDEVKILKTNPLSEDTDADCIKDGIEVHFNAQSAFTGTDSDPRNPDTDGDGLCDGKNNITNGGYGDFAGQVSCYRGEDLDCNGEQTKCENDPGRFCELDRNNPDSDGDGVLDLDEVKYGGRINIEANLGRALYEGPGQGCLSVSGASPTDPNSMLVIFGVLMMVNRLFARRLKRNSNS